VLLLTCDRTYRTGLHELGDLTVPVFGPERTRFPAPREPPGDLAEQAGRAGAVVVEPGCGREIPAEVQRAFELVARRKVVNGARGAQDWSIHLRRVSTPRTAPTAAP
jgi:hypothetical protein